MPRRQSSATTTGGWVVGRVAGAPVVVSPGWLVAAVVLTFIALPTVQAVAPGLGAGAYVVAASVALLLFVSVFLHELAHALVARSRGVVVHELAVTLLGGHTRMGAAAPDPASSAAIAVAGPAVNLGLAAVAWAAGPLVVPGSVPDLLLTSVALTNGFVGVFNLLPGLPLDGGRVLEALVWRGTGRRSRGTVVAGWVGRALAVGVLAWFLAVPFLRGARPDLTMVIWGTMIGAFLWTGAAQAVAAGRSEEALEGLALRTLITSAVTAPVGGTVADLQVGAVGSAVPPGPQPTDDGDRSRGAVPRDVVLLAPDGSPVGYVDWSAVAGVPVQDRGRTPLIAVAVSLPSGTTVQAGLTGSAAVRAVATASREAAVMVAVDEGGRVVGLLRAQDVISALRTGT